MKKKNSKKNSKKKFQKKIPKKNSKKNSKKFKKNSKKIYLIQKKSTFQVETIQESVSKEVVSMKGLYEGELNDARRLLDETAKEKAQLQIDTGKLRSVNEELRIK